MKKIVKIFLETGELETSEAVFIETLLRTRFGKKLGVDFEIVPVGGWTKLEEKLGRLPEKLGLEIEKILIVFDADSPGKANGGVGNRTNAIRKIIDARNLSYEQREKIDVFLFPDNHDDGDFETLLERIVNKGDNTRFFDCFSDFEKCLGDAYEHPNLKAKMHSYINLQKGLSRSQRDGLGRGRWLFDDKKYWDLDSSALEPLKEFFSKNL